jgi:hypothetical protein
LKRIQKVGQRTVESVTNQLYQQIQSQIPKELIKN